MAILSIAVLDRAVDITCADDEVRALVLPSYGHMQRRPTAPDLGYAIDRGAGSHPFVLTRDGLESWSAEDGGELLLRLDNDLTIQLQRLRPDLFFLHAAVVASGDQALMLVAPSGSGKSTTAWALVHHGFRYLSDELGPVDLDTLMVHPYPRALLLKDEPPHAYPLPETTLHTSRGLHVPTAALPHGVSAAPLPLAAVFFLSHRLDAEQPSVRRVGGAEAGARLYANALNPLAHPREGLEAAIRIATHSTCFELCTADLTATCGLVRATLEGSI